MNGRQSQLLIIKNLITATYFGWH